MNNHASIRSRLAAVALLVLSGSLLACAAEPPIPVTESAAIRIQKANNLLGTLYGMPPEASRCLVATYEYKPGQRVDVYWPPDFAFDRQLPLAIFAMTFPDERVRKDTGSSAPDNAVYIDWCASAASRGMAAVIMSVGYAKEDLPLLLAYLEKNRKTLRIDPSRVYVWAASDNWKTAAPICAQGGPLYGKMIGMSLYYTLVSVMTPLPGPGVPVEVVIPDKDSANTTKELAAYAEAISAQGNEVSVVHYPDGRHAFDIIQDTPETRAIVAGTLDFIGKLALKSGTP